MTAGEPAAGEVPVTAVEMFGARTPMAEAYAELLCSAGVERGLLGPREVPVIWDRHLINCALLTELVPANARIVDVGSGAGLPGLTLAIRRPDLRVDLVEPLLRRAAFLEEAVAALGLTESVRVVRGRSEDRWVVEVVGDAGWVTARAVAPLDRLAGWCVPLLTVGGRLLAMKGSRAEAEISESSRRLAALGAEVRAVRELSCGSVSARVIEVERVRRPVATGRRGARRR